MYGSSIVIVFSVLKLTCCMLLCLLQPHGIITVRMRIEMHHEKAALMAALKPRPKIHVNVQKEKSFHVVRYTCFGEVRLLCG